MLPTADSSMKSSAVVWKGRLPTSRTPWRGSSPRNEPGFRAELRRLNSEFAHYVPDAAQLPHVEVRPFGDPEYFPPGVKHRYTRPASPARPREP